MLLISFIVTSQHAQNIVKLDASNRAGFTYSVCYRVKVWSQAQNSFHFFLLTLLKVLFVQVNKDIWSNASFRQNKTKQKKNVLMMANTVVLLKCDNMRASALSVRTWQWLPTASLNKWVKCREKFPLRDNKVYIKIFIFPKQVQCKLYTHTQWNTKYLTYG